MRVEQLAPHFVGPVQRRGMTCYRAGIVTIRYASAEGIAGVAQGTFEYEVRLEVASTGTLRLSCTCPAFADGPCKHLWALVLDASERGLLEQLAPCTRVTYARAGDDHLRTSAEEVFGDDPHQDLATDRSGMVGRPAQVASGLFSRSNTVPRPPAGWRSRLFPALPERYPLETDQERRDQERTLPAELLFVVEVEKTRLGGELTLSLRTRTAKKGGGLTKDKGAQVSTQALNSLENAAQRQALMLFCAAKALQDGAGYSPYSYGYGYSYADRRIASETQVAAAVAQDLLPLVAGAGQLFVRAHRQAALAAAVYEAEPWDFVLTLSKQEGDRPAEVAGVLRRGGESIPVTAPLLITSSGWAVFADRVSPLRHLGAYPLLSSLRSGGPVPLPPGDETAFLDRLYAQPALPRLELPDELTLHEVPGVPVPHLKVRAPRATATPGPPVRQSAELLFRYDDTTVPVDDQRGVIPLADQRRLIRRDRTVEARFVEQLLACGFQRPKVGWNRDAESSVYDITPARLPAAVHQLVAAGWLVEAQGRSYRQPGRFELAVSSGVDWFDLEAQIDFGGVPASLPAVLRALRRGERSIVLGDGSFGMLPEEWLKKFAPLADLGQVDGDRIRFRPVQVGLLDALLASQPEVSVDARFAKARVELGRFNGVRPQAAPAAFRGTLRSYQEAGLGWLSFLRRFGFGGCLADDMGLGKTIQVLAMLAGRARRRGARPSIAVVPKSLVWNWQQEAARFAPKLRVLAHVGPERASSAKALLAALPDVDLLLTTYGVLRKDITFLREIEADYLILDEAQAIKNADSESAKAARLLRGDHRLALSGTPIENHLGGAGAFAAFAGSKRPDPESLAPLARALRPFILRRTKEEVAPELPAKHEETILCEMEPRQRRMYDELRVHYRAKLLGKIARDGLGKAKIQVLEALLRLRQVACHPALVDDTLAAAGSAKLEVLLSRLEEVRREGHKALVFSQFTSFLALVRARLDATDVPYEYLDGQTEDRAARVARFQDDGQCPFFLLSLKAGGVGLNLTAADYVFILDPWWNPAVEAQAVDRAHRIGQSKRVFVYRLLCRDSVEEKVAALQASKRELVSSILAADGSLLKTLDRETLEMLLA